jgi:MFS family permease
MGANEPAAEATNSGPVDTTPPPRAAAGTAGRAVTLGTVLLAVLVVPTSISGTAIALPDIGSHTAAGLASLQWVINAFNLAFACFTLAWGSIADIVGRAKAFAAGAGVYLVASVASALAGTISVLDAARALAGIGGAAIFACGSAILSTVFTGPARNRAFALFGTVAGIGVGIGPSLSGLIVETLGWRWIFGVHAILLAVVLGAVPLVLRVAQDSGRANVQIDVAGIALFSLAMLAATTAIVQGSQWGWTSPGVLGLLVGAIVLFAGFAVVQRKADHPMLDLTVLRNRRYVGLCLIPVAASFGFVTMLTYLPSYLTVVAGKEPGAAGLIMMLLTFPVFACPVLASWLVNRGVRAEILLYGSLGCLIAGDLALLTCTPRFSVGVVAVPMLTTGAGMGLSAGLVDGQALGQVAEEKAGMAAGFLNTLRLGSEAIAVALYGALFATVVHSTISRPLISLAPTANPVAVANILAAGNLAQVARLAGPSTSNIGLLTDSYDSSFHTMLWVLAVICALLSALIVILMRKPRKQAK